MALDAHDDGLMSVDSFPVNLKGEEKTFFDFTFKELVPCLCFILLLYIWSLWMRQWFVVNSSKLSSCWPATERLFRRNLVNHTQQIHSTALSCLQQNCTVQFALIKWVAQRKLYEMNCSHFYISSHHTPYDTIQILLFFFTKLIVLLNYWWMVCGSLVNIC